MLVLIGDISYQIESTPRDGQWMAHAVRADTGDRYGIEVTAPTEGDATSLLTRWLHWQHEHTRALSALQEAERVYHRALADAAFSTDDGRAGTKEARSAVDAARRELDDVRARRPRV